MRFIKTILALALVACGAPAYASGIEPKTLSNELRVFNQTIHSYHMSSMNGFAAQTATITPALAVGADGLIYNRDMNGVTAFTAGSTDTFGAMPYPAKLFISIFDAGNACGCTNGTIWGYNQFGQPIKETISAIYTTAGYTTTNAFEVVTGLTFPSGKCGGGGAACHHDHALATWRMRRKMGNDFSKRAAHTFFIKLGQFAGHRHLTRPPYRLHRV